MSLWDVIKVFPPGGDTPYEEGVDYEIDYDNDTISRIPGGAIPDGASVVVKYAKGVPGQILDDLRTKGEAVLRPVKALVKILTTPDADVPEATDDLTDKCIRIEFRQTLAGKPDEVELVIADPGAYLACDPDTDVIIAAAFGEVDTDGEAHYVECFRGLVVEREFLANPDGAHHVRILIRDFSVSLDSPRQGAMGRTWHPILRREVFKNGALIADDFRELRSSQLYDSLNFDDVIELHFAQEYPNAHQIIRDCFDAAASPFLEKLVIDCLDFPIPFVDAREKTPGQVVREIAQLAGASVRAEGTTLVISEHGFPDGFRTCWVYDAIAILDQGERSNDDGGFTAVQIFGHSETSRIPTKSVYIPPTDFTQPGWCRVVDEEGKLEPNEPVRSDELPQPAELSFQLDGELYDASSIRVLGGELAGQPSVKAVDGKLAIEVTVLIDWKVEDKAGECPYTEDENGVKLFRIHGRVYDAVPNANGEKLPIPHAAVRRESLDGDNPGETFDLSADEDGNYIFEAVPEGKYKIIASAPGYLDNYSDDDPSNDEVRDLHEELQQYQDEVDKGRYEKQETDYHVIVWARPKIDMGPLADLTVSQVLMEVRLESTRHGTPLVYGPPIRDERITTEVLAKRVGQIVLAGAIQESPAVSLRLPPNRWLRVGDGVRATGETLDLPLPESRPFQVTELRKIFDPVRGKAHDIVASSPGRVGSTFARGLGQDPLDTRVGVVVAVYRNELGGRVYDVAADGSILYGLKAWPTLGEVRVGETVQVSRATSGALSYLIVARTTELFGEGRICYV
jgi:hypothetical protein